MNFQILKTARNVLISSLQQVLVTYLGENSQTLDGHFRVFESAPVHRPEASLAKLTATLTDRSGVKIIGSFPQVL